MTTTVDRSGASDAEFEARIAPFDAAPVPPEVMQAAQLARVTEALLITVLGTDDGDMLAGCDLPADEIARLIVEHGAAAAIAALEPSPAEEAVKRVEGVLERQYREAWAAWEATLPTVAGVPASTESRIAWARVNQALSDQEALAAALASPAPAPQGERPHSRACGWRRHAHGPDCHSNCPTCGGAR